MKVLTTNFGGLNAVFFLLLVLVLLLEICKKEKPLVLTVTI